TDMRTHRPHLGSASTGTVTRLRSWRANKLNRRNPLEHRAQCDKEHLRKRGHTRIVRASIRRRKRQRKEKVRMARSSQGGLRVVWLIACAIAALATASSLSAARSVARGSPTLTVLTDQVRAPYFQAYGKAHNLNIKVEVATPNAILTQLRLALKAGT